MTTDSRSALSVPGNPHQWQADTYPDHTPVQRGLSAWRVLVSCLGLPLTAAAAVGAWFLFWPATLVQVRIVADLGGPTGRAALAEAALRMDTGPDRPATLEDAGDALVIAVTHEDAAVARRRARSAADLVLNLRLAATAAQPQPAPAPHPPEPRSANRNALLADQSRLQAALEATDRNAAAASASLTGVIRDIAGGLRIAAERKGGRETLDKGTAALAELQLQRIQVLSRYQDDFPAIVALDGQIHRLRGFLVDETRRIEASRTPGDPSDPVLGAERDRLRGELARLNDRRATLGVELAAATSSLDAIPPETITPEPAPAPVATPVPILIEAATTIATGPDHRWLAVYATATAGLMLVVAAWFKPRRYPRGRQPALLPMRLHTMQLPHGPTASLGGGGYESLAGVKAGAHLAPPGGRTRLESA